MGQQLNFSLQPSDPYSPNYFVRHSGVSEAWDFIADACRQHIANPSYFQLIFVHGPQGVGKTHLLEASRAESAHNFAIVRLSEIDTAAFIDQYERCRTAGGILCVEADCAPNEATNDPHIRSRLLNGTILKLEYPAEGELRPLIESLLERHNLRLSETSIEYLLRRLPLDPLSFSNIFAKISDVSLGRYDSARLGIIRELLSK